MDTRIVALSLAALLLDTKISRADFQRWSAEIEEDPFSGGQKVIVSYMTSLRSGVFITCDTAEPGVRVRAIPGWAYVADLALVEPTVEFAIDGQKLLEATGSTGSVGDNLAAAEVTLTDGQAQQFVKAFASAKKQVAIKDGISDAPHLLRASGSTKSGASLVKCLEKQTE